jgi:MYXO-CTERM domain-containing protein
METSIFGGVQRAELRAKLNGALDKTKAFCGRVQERTVAAAKASDVTIRKHPYQSIGAAFGVGMLLGALVLRRRHHS